MSGDERPRLWLHTAVEAHFLTVPPRPWEVGGWLLGYWTGDENNVFVTHATPPGPRGWPWGVRISGAGHRQHFDAAWAASGRHVTFLGDWHTHPGGPARPSSRDRAAMGKLAKDDDYGTPRPVIGVIETPRWPWTSNGRQVQFFLKGRDQAVRRVPYALTDHLPAAAAGVPDWW